MSVVLDGQGSDAGVAQKHGVLLTVAYDGTNFSGWQLQPSDRSVQGDLEKALEKICKRPVRVRASGRTDAGVHARAQMVAFDAPLDIPREGWIYGVNAHLPDDVVIRDAVPCAVGYDPRFDTLDKVYRYEIYNSRTANPLMRHRAWWVRRPLDVAAMKQAATHYVGKHDFCAFHATDDDRTNTVREILNFTLDSTTDVPFAAEQIHIAVTGKGFMKQMVRILVGTLVEVGHGRREPEEILALLTPGTTRGAAGLTAPPEGLTLHSVRLGRRVQQARLADPEP